VNQQVKAKNTNLLAKAF